MKLFENVLNYDMYSKRTSFFYNNQEKIGSLLGLFLTFVYILASMILLIYQIILALQRQELKVYDTTMYSQEMPTFKIDTEQFYFAFGLEDPQTSNRFIDDSIYIPKIVFVDKVKVNDEFVTVDQRTLEYEKCNVEKFGKNFQHLFIKDELNNSYCLKNIDFNLTLTGGYKYERMTYIRIRIYPCVNNTENNNTCKPQDKIDYYMSSGYFSIIFKDFGLNPSNYSVPVLPKLQDLYTTIDKRLMKNYILNFGVTEVHTDTGIIQENIKINKYLQFRNELQTFSFRNEEDYYSGKSVILVQIKLDDNLSIQKRTYLKLSVIFSRIGGYMQLMNTVFLLITSIFNRMHSQLKIINSIFNFNLKQNKVILKFETLKEPNILKSKSQKHLIFSSKKSINNLKHIEIDNKSKNNLIIKENEIGNISSGLNISDNKKTDQNFTLKLNKNNIIPYEKPKDSSINIKNEQNNNINNIKENPFNYSIDNLEKNINFFHKGTNNLSDYNDYIDLNLFDYLCTSKNSIKFNLFTSGNYFYRKKMDIVHVFTLISIIELIFMNNNYQNLDSSYEEIKLLNRY